jgi:5-formyltetrahydrofolate cyclo-ligase
MNKQALRKQALDARAALSEADFQNRSQQIANHFLESVDLSAIRVLHTFLPVIAKKEPDTWLIINRIKSIYPAIQISIPKISGDHVKNYFLEGDGQLEVNKFGISEPTFGEETSDEAIDIVLVPLLAADIKGNRIGYGKGYYDRFLGACTKDCLKIGLSLFDPIDHIPAEAHDIPLDQLITPQGIISFR